MLKNTLLMGLATALLSTTALAVTEERVPEYCWYEDQQVDVHTVECEYEVAFEHYGLPYFHFNDNPSRNCPTKYWRKVSLEKDLTKTKTFTQEGSMPSCGTRWMSHTWESYYPVNGEQCNYWWREGKNVVGSVDRHTVTTETRRVRICEPAY
ncbi:hypothetical protein CWB96_10705 [Pseudoalteromonas citrea]|uniref:Uncharacterized protein n=1 Tax=Pseudoalteromonas citrea TaxID=43655 RepID=A0A5S3XPB4_9GAMM|nr:hypothetical protein [Pseudoalteromonas citrea]TMP45647.1 hypothetical protein CWB97_03350 [Pseudoalteromonas citrea]TMP59027.1 hypothetical protein CWB96_10705 [Pseudoalteromonas citrea]